MRKIAPVKKNSWPLASCLFLWMAAGCNNPAPTLTLPENTISSNTVQLSEVQLANADVATDSLRLRDVSGLLKLTGIIDVPPQNLASVSMPLGGYVKQIKLLPGMPVKKGEVLAILEDQQYIQLQQDYLIQKSNLILSQAEFIRQQTLNETQATSSKTVEQAEAAYNIAKTNVNALAAKLRLIHINPETLSDQRIRSSINIYAPFNGFVSSVHVNTGKYVSPSDVLFELVDPTDIHLNLKVFENDLPYLQKNQPLEAYTNAHPDKRYPCNILLISKLIPNEKTAEVHCHFNKYDPNLVPGMFMNAEVTISKKNVVAVPDEAIVQYEGKQFVFVPLSASSFQLTEVRCGESYEGFTEIKDWPLVHNQKVVIKGAYALLMALKNVPEEE